MARINTISRSVTIILVLVITSFTLTVGWSLSQLQSSFKTVKFFTLQKDAIYLKITIPIQSYLYNGDFKQLKDIENELAVLNVDLNQNESLTDSFRAPFQSIIMTIQTLIKVDLSAAGKIVDPQVLLKHNEQELAVAAHNLFKYTSIANKASASDRQRYVSSIHKLQSTLLSLSLARQNFFSSDFSGQPTTLNFQVEQLHNIAAEMAKLPLLGVLTTPKQSTLPQLTESTFSAEDQALEPLAAIESLANRYTKEMSNVQLFSQQKKLCTSRYNKKYLICKLH